MNEWQIVLLFSGILTFFVGTIIPIIKPLIKLNKVMERNTNAIDMLSDKIEDLTTNNKEDHDHFFSSINHLKTDVEVLKTDIENLRNTKEN